MFKPKCEKTNNLRPLSMNLLEKTRRNKEMEIDLNKKQCAVASRPSIHSLPDDNRRRSLNDCAKENIPSVHLSISDSDQNGASCLCEQRMATSERYWFIFRLTEKIKHFPFDMEHQFRRVTRDSHCIARAGRRHLIFGSIVFRRRVQSVQSLWSFSFSSWNDRKLEIQIPLSSTACVTWGGSLQAAVCFQTSEVIKLQWNGIRMVSVACGVNPKLSENFADLWMN